MLNSNLNESLCEKWEPILEGIGDESTRQMTAVLLENQAKSILTENTRDSGTLEEATTVGNLGTFQKFAFPLVRRVFPELIANKICGVQPMQGPVSQIFYLGYNRAGADSTGAPISDVVYSKYRMVYGGRMGTAQNNVGSLDSANATAGLGGFNLSGLSGLDANGHAFTDSLAVSEDTAGINSTSLSAMTAGSRIANFPNSGIAGPQFFVSAGERLAGSGIPEVNFTIEQQSVTARTRKFRALWTLEASQDLRAYHNLDLERELTELLSKEVALEIDREIVESIRTLAYGIVPGLNNSEWDAYTDSGNSNNFGNTGLPQGAGNNGTGTGAQGSFTFNQPYGGDGGDDAANYGLGSNPGVGGMPTEPNRGSNVFFCDFGTTALGLAPRHVGEVYSNLVAVVNFASQDIYRTTLRSAANYIVCSPFVAAMLQSAAKLEGGIDQSQAGTLGASIEYKGKWMGQYDVYVDPLYPEDEILLGYKGASPMDAGFVYAPYIPLQMLPTITDPQTFQPRKGLITRYATAQINPASRFYRIIRIVGADSRYLTTPFMKATAGQTTTYNGY